MSATEDEYWLLQGKVCYVKYNPIGSILVASDSLGNIYAKEFSKNNNLSSFQVGLDSCEDTFASIKPAAKIEFIKSSKTRANILTAIDKSIEIWKIFPQPCGPSQSMLSLKRDSSLDGVHECTINSLSMCQNNKNFISSDDLNIYLWDISYTNKVCHIVDHKKNLKPISEVITSAKFHPNNSHEILWTSTNGSIRVGDLRTKFLLDQPTQIFKYVSNSNSYFDELVASLSYAEFCNNAECIVARDYFTVKYWDLRNNSRPCLKVDVIENSTMSMNDLYQSQAICAEFEVKDCDSSEFCITGAYGKVALINRLDGSVDEYNVGSQNEVLHLDINANGDIVFGEAEFLRCFNSNTHRN